MEESEIAVLLKKISAEQAVIADKLNAKGESKSKDKWDKFAIVSSFISSVLIAALGVLFTVLQSRHNNQVLDAQRTRDNEQKARQQVVDDQQKRQQTTVSYLQMTAQILPTLEGPDSSIDVKRHHTISILKALPDKDFAEALVQEFTSPESVSALPTLANLKKLNTLVRANGPSTSDVHQKAHTDPGGHAGEVVLFDGFKNFAISGFQFSSGNIVPWGSDHVDIEVANPDSSSTSKAVFFLEKDVPPYTNATLQLGRQPASAGILEMTGQTYGQIKTCPETGYLYHYFMPKEKTSYCVQTFDGQHYAKILVNEVRHDQISF